VGNGPLPTELFNEMGHRADDCPRSEQAYQGILSLPIYPLLAPRRARFIAGQVREILAGFGKKR
jgi:dTDP-4-amino-4,6-dideoxygalactose transaminase